MWPVQRGPFSGLFHVFEDSFFRDALPGRPFEGAWEPGTVRILGILCGSGSIFRLRLFDRAGAMNPKSARFRFFGLWPFRTKTAGRLATRTCCVFTGLSFCMNTVRIMEPPILRWCLRPLCLNKCGSTGALQGPSCGRIAAPFRARSVMHAEPRFQAQRQPQPGGTSAPMAVGAWRGRSCRFAWLLWQPAGICEAVSSHLPRGPFRDLKV